MSNEYKLEMADVVKAHLDVPGCPVLTTNQCHAIAMKLNAMLAAAPQPPALGGEPFFYALCGADGKPHFDDFCVASEAHHLECEEDGVTVVPLYRRAQPATAKVGGEVLEKLKELVSAVRSINRSPKHEIRVIGDDKPCYAQRKEWVEWLLSICDDADEVAKLNGGKL